MLQYKRVLLLASLSACPLVLAVSSCSLDDAQGDAESSTTPASVGSDLRPCRGNKKQCDGGPAPSDASTTSDASSTADGSSTTDASGGGTDAATDSGGPTGGTSAKKCGPTAAATAQTFYVAPGGSDANNGSSTAPWATITWAVDHATDGSTILVRPGTYVGTARLDRRFATGVVVRSEQPYAAKLRNSGLVLRAWYGRRITLEGFDIAHSGAGATPLVVQIQSVDTANPTSEIVLRNNVIHDSYNNDLIKLNNAANNVTIEGNVFYNQAGSDEHIDVNSVRDCVVQDNIFFNDFGGSGRTNGNDTSAFVVVKDSNGTTDGVLGSERITVRRNVLLNWQGNSNYGFFQMGEDGTANFEAMNVMVENNLLIGNSSNPMRSPFGAMGVRDITFRHNTVVGNVPGPSTFGFAARMYTVASNQPNQNIQFFNNIWSDPTGTMARFSISEPGLTTSFTLRKNLYWNNGAAIPSNASDLMNVDDDTSAVLGDPGLGGQAGIVVPRLTGTTFADGSTSVCQAFERLVTAYGTPSTTSKALGAADATQSPDHDILVRPRPGGTGNAIGAAQR